jgi:S1-C subfamily serine protease
MLRALVVAAILLVVPSSSTGQTLGTLRVRIVLTGEDGAPAPAPRYALLVSDDPPSAAPRRIMTALDGTVEVKLRPGTYIVESDKPLAFHGRRYQWTQTVEIAAGRDAVLDLTAANAEVTEMAPADAASGATPGTAASDAAPETDTTVLVQQWWNSVVGIWTASTHASGFLVDARGLVVTNQRGIGTATSAEVQLTRDRKVAGRVVAADAGRDVAILQIDPAAAAGIRAVPLECTSPGKPPEKGAELITVGVPLRGEKDMSSGMVSDVTAKDIATDFVLPSGSAGGPVFSAGGTVLGVTSFVVEPEDPDTGRRRRRDSRVVPIGDVCAALASVEPAISTGQPPGSALLPVEPKRPFPVDALENSLERRLGLEPYTMSSADFDIVLLTPPVVYHQLNAPTTIPHTTSKETRSPNAELSFMRRRMEFGTWSDYVSDILPVLMIRVTPRFAEGFWTKVGRIAAETQGVALPQFKRYKSGFVRLRALCGTVEVTPIHPFELETPISERAAIDEGLYVFEPGALGPQCGTVTLVLQSATGPEQGDRRVVDPKMLELIWQDFEPYRKAAGAER